MFKFKKRKFRLYLIVKIIYGINILIMLKSYNLKSEN